MPNMCAIDIKIAGKEEAVQEMVQMLSRTGPFAPGGLIGLGRVFHFNLDESFTERDPTDPSKKNKKYQLPKPVITVADSKKTLVKYGSTYKLKAGITAQDPNTFQNLTGLITVHKVRWYDSAVKKYVEKKFSTKRCGTYKVTYKVKYKYGGTTYKTLKIRVAKPLAAPKVSTENLISENGLPILEWKAVKNATKYKIYRSTAEKGPYKWFCTTKKTTYTNSLSVESGKSYYYKIKAVNDNKKHPDSTYSNVVKRVIP